jgi:nitroreductase
MNASSTDKPSGFPTTQVNGAPLKPITQVLLDRRATDHFKPDAVPDEYLDAVLAFAAQAPSGYDLQPWRFIVVREKKNRERLQKAAFNQPKVAEAPVVVIVCAPHDEWKNRIDDVFQEQTSRGRMSAEEAEKTKKTAVNFIEGFSPAIWLNRHTVIAFTTMMLVAEAYGLDTAPMEGFDPEAVKKEFGIPPASEVVALLAIGFAAGPERPYPGRLPLKDLVHHERY